MFKVVYFIVLVLFSVGFRYHLHLTQVCRAIGIRISPSEYLILNRNGFQDALTDPKDHIPHFIITITCLGLIVGSFFYFSVGMGIISIITFLLSNVLSGVILFGNYESRYYVMRVYGSMTNRYANYVKNNDSIRAGAAQELMTKIEEHYFRSEEFTGIESPNGVIGHS